MIDRGFKYAMSRNIFMGCGNEVINTAKLIRAKLVKYTLLPYTSNHIRIFMCETYILYHICKHEIRCHPSSACEVVKKKHPPPQFLGNIDYECLRVLDF